MSYMKRLSRLVLALGIMLSLFAFTTPAFADPVTGAACNGDLGGGSGSSYCDQNGSNPLVGPNGTITKVIRLLAIATGIAAVISIIIGGFMYVTSGGDPNSVKSARTTITYSVVGLVVVAGGQAILTFVLSKL